ncbi:prolipoprotein diacylglyceryl transferase [Paenibacillus psychroresistens]|uniref:Phosphatidylglycerol--prolipoprotein diacylglyceryl transferase n=1 Tax=Paenibacillus psychroresistens TaxID=1778678 RepID=A0A6B8REE0_9BACL|nr:prolipoprotein diacylglyceryl transferase [Paenibacillus psychroresistens]QGQ93726.1 prolipoprotein diacylglyceryl transferase [Paenibacillus psychroresistens]
MYLAINPIAFSIGAIDVRWYGIVLGTAALIALMIAIQEGKRFNIIPDFFMDFLLVAIPSAIVGARAYYVIFKWDDYKNNLWEVFMIWHGGIAIYGGLIGSIIGVIFYVRAKGYDFWRIVDLAAPGLIVGQMIGRWGNFMNQEAHGGPVDESVLRNTLHLPNFIVNQMNIEGIFYHPTFLYESIWTFIGFIVLIVLRRRPFVKAGEIFIGYFIWYSIGRFFIEGLRTDSLAFSGPSWLASLMDGLWSPMKLLFDSGELDEGNVRVSQLLSVLIILAAIVIIYYRRSLVPPTALYSDPIVSTKAPVLVTDNDSEAEATLVEIEPPVSVMPDEIERPLKE